MIAGLNKQRPAANLTAKDFDRAVAAAGSTVGDKVIAHGFTDQTAAHDHIRVHQTDVATKIVFTFTSGDGAAIDIQCFVGINVTTVAAGNTAGNYSTFINIQCAGAGDISATGGVSANDSTAMNV